MITRAQLTQAKTLLALGGSLAGAAELIGSTPEELDLALWTGVGGSKAFRPLKRRKPRRRKQVRQPTPEMRPWTGAEQRKLRMYWLDGVPCPVIARAMKRTEGAIYARAAQMRLPTRRLSGANATPQGLSGPQDEPNTGSRDSGRESRSEAAA